MSREGSVTRTMNYWICAI